MLFRSGGIMRSVHFFVDCENVGSSQYFDEDWAYFYYFCNHTYRRATKATPRLEVYNLDIVGRNALDFILDTVLGKVISENMVYALSNDSYVIVSKDKGFNHVVDFWLEQGVDICRIDNASKYKFKGTIEDPTEVITRAQYIINSLLFIEEVRFRDYIGNLLCNVWYGTSEEIICSVNNLVNFISEKKGLNMIEKVEMQGVDIDKQTSDKGYLEGLGKDTKKEEELEEDNLEYSEEDLEECDTLIPESGVDEWDFQEKPTAGAGDIFSSPKHIYFVDLFNSADQYKIYPNYEKGTYLVYYFSNKAVSIDTNYEFPVVGNIKDNYDLLLLFGARIKGLNFGGANCEIHIVSTDSKVRGFAERFRLFGFNCDVDDNLVIVHKDTVEPSKSSLIEQCYLAWNGRGLNDFMRVMLVELEHLGVDSDARDRYLGKYILRARLEGRL